MRRILAVVGGCLSLLVAESAEMPSRGICAHRGDRCGFPENTVPAFVSAVKKGAAMVEFDVTRCATGELVVMHDWTVDRTTTGTGDVVNLTFEYLRSLDAGVKKGPQFAGTKIPTFDEAIDCFPKDGVWLNVHCKSDVPGEVAQKIKEKGRLHQAFIAAGRDGVRKAREAVPEVKVCFFAAPSNSWGHVWTAAERQKAIADVMSEKAEFTQPHYASFEPEELAAYHAAGGKVNYFWCNKPERLGALMARGIDFPLTDNLEPMVEAFRELQRDSAVPDPEMGFSYLTDSLPMAAVVAERRSGCASEPAVVQEADTYNSWPMVQALGKRLVCAYSRGSEHSIDEGGRGVFVRHSDDGGRTWSAAAKIVDDPKEGEVTIGKGLDEAGTMLLWVRCWDKWGSANLHHDLYRSADGVRFERIAELHLDPNPMQITDIVRLPGVGLMSLWFAGLYEDDGTCAWGTLVSADNGRTWRQTTIERGLQLQDWPTEPSLVSLGGGRLLAVARSEKNSGALFQLMSSDSGRTWKKLRTNVADVAESTPSLVRDEVTGELSLYYYHRGAKKLKRRVACADKVLVEPTSWSDPEILFIGAEERPYDAGNVNVTVLNGTHYAGFYTGSSKKTAVLVLSAGQFEAKVK